MADAIVSAVINKVVDIGATMNMEESSRLYWLREDVWWLEREMRHMRGYLENAEAKKVTNPNVVNLIKDIRDLVHDVEDILDIYLPQIESHRSSGLPKRISTCFMPYCWTSRKFLREIAKIRRRVESIETDRTRYGVVDDISGTDNMSNVDPRTTKLHVDDPIIVGFEQHITELKSKLEDHRLVSVVGMPGLGKTTLAKKVFEDIKDDFDCFASVSVSQKPNITSLMRDIANQVGLEKEKQEENMKVNLYSFLQGKRYVVFLDDIWGTETWDSFVAYIPIRPESASRIIITSRNNSVGRYIGGENSLHQLHPFDESTSWELFSRSIDIPSPGLETIGRQIVKKCGGVPLAIAVIVGLLRERGMEEFSWNGVLHSIGQDAGDKCSQILGWSYGDLPTSLKPCFLYFGNFPEDYEFSASEVIRLWMAEKFIPRVGEDWEPEDVGADYISKLEARNLIQVIKRGNDGRVKKFRVHDLLHSLCMNMGREIDFLNTIDHLESSSAERVRRFNVCYNSLVENKNLLCQMSKLRALFSVRLYNEIEIRFFNNTVGKFKLLQTLILSYGGASHVYIPSQIKSLRRLKYLKIQFADLVEIPRSIQNLKNLQTLDFRTCFRVKLPIGIWKMEQLRHLLLWIYEIDSSLMRLLRQYQQERVLLPNLQTFYCYTLEPTWLLKLTNLRKLVSMNVTPEIMEVLCGPEPISKKLESLCCSTIFRCVVTRRMSLVKYDSLMKLKMTGVVLSMQQPLELPPSIIKLTLIETQLSEDPMKILKNLPELKILHLENVEGFGSKMDCSGTDSFPQLQVLRLYDLRELEELIEGEEMGMPRLKEVTIQYCDRLMQIPERLEQLRMRN